MIQDQNSLEEIRKEWRGVRNIQTSIFVGLAASGGLISGIFPFKIADISYSLVLIYGYAVLQTVLQHLRDEGLFTSPKKDNRLGTLMDSSREKLNWLDFNEVYRGRGKRNDIAHEELVLQRGEAWKFIDAIEQELINWRIIPDQKIDYSIPWGKREQKTLILTESGRTQK